MLIKLILEHLSLQDSVLVELVFDDLLVQYVVAELVLVDAVNEVLLRYPVSAALRAHAFHSLGSELAVLDDFFNTKELILASDVESDNSSLCLEIW